MLVCTTRFGEVDVDPLDVFLFPAGLIGFEESRHFMLLGEPSQSSVVWLQSLSEPDLAFLAVSPRRYVRDYRLRAAQSELAAVLQAEDDETFVLALASRGEHAWTLNLRAPIVLNPVRRLGKQIVTLDEQPVQYVLPRTIGAFRKTA